jgi:Ran GTPase-activating protein (RanGAP) involved in mRNA processing and transport
VRIWDGEIGDEGARAISNYITDTQNSSVGLIELLNSGIGPLGCEFISRMFEGSLPSNISILTLDYNQFGNEGLFNLMNYIKTCKSLKYLSLAYCNIDEKGVNYLDKFLSSTTTLETLILQGNPLKNSGMSELISILYNNSSIEEINLNNVLFGNDPEGVVSNFANLMASNQTLIVYHIKFNFITDQGKIFFILDFEVIFKSLKESCTHICQFSIDEKINKALFDEYFKMMKGRKRPKKKAKGKGKGKGKGK